MTDIDRLPPPDVGEIGRMMMRIEKDIGLLRMELAQNYVRQDVWQKAEQGAGVRVGEIAKDLARMQNDLHAERLERNREMEKRDNMRDADRRLIFTAIFAPILTGIIVAIVLYSVLPA